LSPVETKGVNKCKSFGERAKAERRESSRNRGGGFEALFAMPVKSASMDIDRETVAQVLLSVGVVALFIVVLAGLSIAFGTPSDVDRTVTGDLTGDFSTLSVEDESVSGQFEGELSANFDGTVSGDLTGPLQGDNLTGEFDGTISGQVEGTAVGDVEGTLDQENETFSGTFNGTVTGEDEGTTLSPSGGLVLVIAIALFILAMPIAGYIIENRDFD